jgi:hypothetical protein
MPRDKEKPVVKPKEKSVLPSKPDEKSHPDPLKRFAALKEWRKAVDKILGHEEVMKWKPKKTISEAEKEMDKVGEEKPKEKSGAKKVYTMEQWAGDRPVKGLEESKKDFGKRHRIWLKKRPKI